MGVGTVSLGQFLDFRNDLGIQTELITGGIADLVERGNTTGLRKEIHRGKVVVTVPRTYVDFVVTEFGITELRGKTVQERARALCDIAHPDFRDLLRASARELYCA